MNAILMKLSMILKWGIAIKSDILKFKNFMFVYWAMVLSVSGMYTMYMIHLGFSKTEISIAVTFNTVSGLLGQNFIGYMADRFRQVKKLMFFTISIGTTVAVALMFAKQSWHIYILISIWAFFVYGTVPLTEAWCIGLLKAGNEMNSFGKIRGMGSIGYGISGVLLGLLLQNLGWHVLSWYILASVILTMLSVLLLREVKNGIEFHKGGNKGEAANGKISYSDVLKETFKIKPLRSMLVIVFLYFFVLKGVYNYLGVLVSDFGGGPLSLGFTYFFDATPEVVTFFLTARLMRKFHSRWLIIMAFILQILRLSLIIVFNSSIAIMLMGILSGFAFGMLATAYKTYIYDLAPEKYKISCVSLSESIIGFSGVLSVPVFGFVLMKFGGSAAIAMGLVIDLAALAIILQDVYKSRISNQRLKG